MQNLNKFSHCENLKVSEFESIQEGYFFLCFNYQSFIIHSVSENIAELFFVNSENVINTNFSNFIDTESITRLRECISKLQNIEYSYSTIAINFKVNGTEFKKQAYFYLDQEDIIIEMHKFELAQEEDESINLINNFIKKNKLINYINIEKFCNEFCELIQKITKFDRVYYCQFEDDQHGYVLGESKTDTCESILHHHFPASDVPMSIRTLYLLNRMRLILEADYLPVKIISSKNKFSLNMSIARDIGKTHLIYLKNMGIAASASFSVVEENTLRGLIGCHNYTPKQISFFTMSKVSLLVEHFSLMLRSYKLEKQDIYQDNALLEFKKNFEENECHLEKMSLEDFKIINHVIKFDYLVYGKENIINLSEEIKNIIEAKKFKELLINLKSKDIYYSDCIKNYDDYFLNFPIISGVLVFCIDETSEEFFALIRKEQIQSLKWSGNPEEFSQDDGIIGPRNSFKTWYQAIKYKSLPWSQADLFYHGRIKNLLLESRSKYLTNISKYNKILIEKNQQIELLLSEVHHRVKNNLAILNALFDWKIRETNEKEVIHTLKEMKSRVISISLLHESLYQENNFGSVDLKKYINSLAVTAKDIFSKTNNVSIKVTIPANISVPLQQTLPFGLIVHEFITNSIKYAFKATESGEIVIEWKEEGNSVKFILRDNGIGCKDLMSLKRKSIGIELIKLLIQQLDANYEWSGEAGVKIEIKFDRRKCAWLKLNPK